MSNDPIADVEGIDIMQNREQFQEVEKGEPETTMNTVQVTDEDRRAFAANLATQFPGHNEDPVALMARIDRWLATGQADKPAQPDPATLA